MIKPKFIMAYMDVAKRFANLSYAKRLQVGCLIVKDDRIISIGYNGTPEGWNNECENKIYGDSINEYPLKDEHGNYKLVTKPEVLHAESNCISKLAKSSESGDGATMFITHSPCIECAKLIFQTGIREIYVDQEYRSNDGINFLSKCGVKVTKIADINN